MSSVQVAVSFAAELISFHNIDLFHQGAFQVRCYWKNNTSSPFIIEPPTAWDRLRNESFNECVAPSYVSPADPRTNIPSKAVSKSILIIYKEETVRMYDVFEQIIYFQIDALLIEELIYKSEIILVVELWFAEKKNESFEEMKNVCERQLKVHFLLSQGLHHHTTVMFDYYYLAALDVLVHASVISISPCYLRLAQSADNDSADNIAKNMSLYKSWHGILFNTGKMCGRRHTACLIHTHLCRLLISVIEGLFSTFQEALSFISPNKRSKIDAELRSQLCPFQKNSYNWMKCTHNELERLVTVLQAQTNEDDMADQASIDITKLSSRIVVLYNEYLKNVSYNIGYVDYLNTHTHKLRIKRFSEAFFFQESSIINMLAVYDPKYANPVYLSNFASGRTPLTSVNHGENSDDFDDDEISLATSSCSGDSPDVVTDDHALSRRSSATLVRQCYNYPSFSTNGHESLVAKVRDSTYYRQLPPLPIECSETDGHSYDQPIIIEEIFVPDGRHVNNTDARNLSGSSSGSDVDAKNQREDSIYCKKRHNSMYENIKTISAIRNINPHFDRRDLRLTEEKNRVYRNVCCNGDSGIISHISTTKLGLETLKMSKTSMEVMSRSMPNLSHLSIIIQKKDHKIHRQRTSSWACDYYPYYNSTLPSSEEYCPANKSYIFHPRYTSHDKLSSNERMNDTHLERPHSVVIYGQDDSMILTHSSNLSKHFSKSSTLLSLLSQSSSEDNYKSVIFNQLKFNLMDHLKPFFQGKVYSDILDLSASKRPYFSMRDSDNISLSGSLHYVICVHGLDGEHRDLRLVKTYLSLALPEQRFEFLMSEANEQDNFTDINIMKERLIKEIIEKMENLKEKPEKISFIGHSLGCVLIRAAIASPRMDSLIPRFYTFLSLGGPHLGTVYGSSMLVNVGLWVMQKVRKSICLQQLSMKDSLADLRQSYLYELSGQRGLEYFKYVLLTSSPQDRYVPYHSTRIELCRSAIKDNSEMGVVYIEMVTKLLQRLLRSGKTTVVRYDAHYTLPRSANNYIGRAAHIALIDSELFLEKFLSVSAAKYFR